jgi:predicted transcriptional regulator
VCSVHDPASLERDYFTKKILHFLDVNRSSVEEIRKELNLVRRTVQRDLSKLVTLALIKEIAKSKTDPTKYYELL